MKTNVRGSNQFCENKFSFPIILSQLGSSNTSVVPMIDYTRKSFIYKQLLDDRMGILGINYNWWGVRWLSGRVSDSGARGPGFETYRRRVESLSKTLYSPKVLVNYPGSDGSVPT